MGNNIFDYIKDDFFNIFVGTQYKRINYDILQFLYNHIEVEEQFYTKNQLIDLLTPFLENFDLNTDKNTRDFCLERINIFIDYGWLVEDNDGFKKTYEFDENAIKFLQLMDEISKNETKQYEFSGYVYNIYASLVKSFQHSKSTGIIEQAYKQSIELRNNLKGLNSNIRKYLTNLIRNNKARPKDILNIVLTEYQDKVILKAFKNFREKDNPSLYKAEILRKIDKFEESEEMDKLVITYIKTKFDSVDTQEHRNEAEKELRYQLDTIYDLFDNIEVLVSKLEIQNSKYLSSAKARLRFLLNENRDIEGNIIQILKDLANFDNDFYDDDLFNLYESLNIDDNSLYEQPIRKSKPESTIDDLILDDSEFDIEGFKKILLRDKEFSVESINSLVLELLKNKDIINLKDIPAKDSKDVVKLFLIIIYSCNKVVDYKIQATGKRFECLDWILDDCVIMRGEKDDQ